VAAKTKDVFCKALLLQASGVSGTSTPWTESYKSWLLEEDVEIIGFQMHTVPSLISENDGYTICDAVLSQALQAGVGEMGHIKAIEMWNSTPSAVCVLGLSEVVMFDPANTIKLKEGQQLYFGLGVDGAHQTAGIYMWDGGVIIYWRRR